MRARKTSEYEKDGRMLGDHKEQMSAMFDTRAEQGNMQKNELLKTLESNKKGYDRQLYSDWIVKVYDTCRVNCLLRPHLYQTRSA